MSKYVKKIQIQVCINCFEVLPAESYAIAEATDVIDKESLEKRLNSAITKALIDKGLHPGKAGTCILADIDDEIDD